MQAQDLQPQIKKIEQLISKSEYNLAQLKDALQVLSSMAEKPDYSQVPGITGYFDGSHLVDESGNKYEVPANYAAKSRIMYGDSLKMIEEEGKTIFKLTDKQEKRKIEGVLNKKDGKWYLLADTGTYKISDVAAEFNGAVVQAKARALVPENKLNAPFAALDKVYLEEPEKASQPSPKPVEEAKNGAEKSVNLTSDSAEHSILLNNTPVQPMPIKAEPVALQVQEEIAVEKINTEPAQPKKKVKKESPKDPENNNQKEAEAKPTAETPAAPAGNRVLEDFDLR
jgi:hypothetical protein